MRRLLLLLAVSCGPGTGARSTGPAVQASHVVAPPGVELVIACTPTGPELCFNAIDDNCNGVIDEGCGVATGVLQFVVAWGDSPANVDLHVYAPNGESVGPRERASESGLHLDRDCPKDTCNGQNVENAYFEGTDPPRGHYKVEIWLEDLNKAELPVRARFGARVGGKTFGADVELAHEDEKKTFGFDL